MSDQALRDGQGTPDTKPNESATWHAEQYAAAMNNIRAAFPAADLYLRKATTLQDLSLAGHGSLNASAAINAAMDMARAGRWIIDDWIDDTAVASGLAMHEGDSGDAAT